MTRSFLSKNQPGMLPVSNNAEKRQVEKKKRKVRKNFKSKEQVDVAENKIKEDMEDIETEVNPGADQFDSDESFEEEDNSTDWATSTNAGGSYDIKIESK